MVVSPDGWHWVSRGQRSPPPLEATFVPFARGDLQLVCPYKLGVCNEVGEWLKESPEGLQTARPFLQNAR
jgi:hypothetical protein